MTDETAMPLVADRYRLDTVIGSGGVGRVWRGEDTVLRRAVAVKEVPLPGHLPDAERQSLRTRVLREAQAAARIHHPGSVQVYDVVDEADQVYLVMELVDELTLAEVVSTSGPLTPAATAAVGAELLGALEAAHGVGIVHRDVKPRNVMVLPSGGVKLADFGIATLRDDPSITKTGMVLGTPSYMSPEQALGDGAGPPSDLWSTGALLYYAVEGVPPFDRGEPIATLHAVVHGEPRPFGRAGALAPVITDLLAKDPTRRLGLAEAKSRLESVAADAGGDQERTVAMAAAATRAAPAHPTAAEPEPTAAPAPPTTVDEPTSAGLRAEPGRYRQIAAPPPNAPPSGPARRLPLAALGAVLGLLVLGGILLSQLGDDGTASDAGDAAAPDASSNSTPATSAPEPVTDEPADEPADEPSDDGGDESAPDDEPAPSTTAPTDDGAADRPEGVPASWVPYTEPEVGWTIWRPADWQPTPAQDNAVDLVDPATGDYLRVDYVQPPGDDAVAAWEASSASFASRFDDYEEISIEPTTYQGYEAALWEYTYQGQHATNLGIVTPGTGYALNFRTGADRWEERQDVREAFEAGFTIPG